MPRFDFGWVKLHRDISKTPIGKDAVTLGLFTTLIMWANREETSFVKGKDVVQLQRGQILTSACELACQLDLNRKTVQRKLLVLEKLGKITQKVSNDGRIITICNYDEIPTSPEAPVPRDGQHDGQHVGHIMEKKRKREKKKEGIFPAGPHEGEAEGTLFPEPPKLEISLPTPRDLVALWNEYKSETQSKVNPSTFKADSERWRHAQARLLDVPGLPYWKEVISRLASNPFCNGKNDRGWTADFDFLIRKETHIKAMEGKYGTGPVSTTPKKKEIPIITGDNLEDFL